MGRLEYSESTSDLVGTKNFKVGDIVRHLRHDLPNRNNWVWEKSYDYEPLEVVTAIDNRLGFFNDKGENKTPWYNFNFELVSAASTASPVSSPAHYNTGEIECIDAIKASMSPEEFKGYLKGNSLKYMWRYRYKGKPFEDLKKAQWYLERLTKCVSIDK